MYADRAPRAGLNAGSLAGAIAINGAVLAALLFASPEIREKLPIPPLPIEMIPLDPPPPPEPIPPQPNPPREARTIPDRIETTTATIPRPDDTGVPTYPPLPPLPPQPGTGAATTIVEAPPAPPVLVDAAVDSSAAFQPDYPPSERRAENEGVVRIRVLIGADGRVKQAQRLEAASDAFWRATERQALSRWRFRPATRDGVAIEQWRTFTVRFRLENA